MTAPRAEPCKDFFGRCAILAARDSGVRLFEDRGEKTILLVVKRVLNHLGKLHLGGVRQVDRSVNPNVSTYYTTACPDSHEQYIPETGGRCPHGSYCSHVNGRYHYSDGGWVGLCGAFLLERGEDTESVEEGSDAYQDALGVVV